MSPSPETLGLQVQALVEWEQGTTRRFRLEGNSLQFYREEPRPAPCNYGCLPGTLNPADGAEIDAIWLEGPLPVGTAGPFTVSGLLWLQDQDHKVLLGDLSRLQPVLDWFPPERGAKVLSSEAARQWLQELGAL